MPKQSQDIETDAGKGTVSGPRPFGRLIRKMAEMASTEEVLGSNSGTEDIDRILTAEDEESMWDSDELAKWNATKLSGCDLQTLGFEVKFGDMAGSSDNDIKTVFTDPATGKQIFLLIRSFRVNNSGNTKEYNLPPVGEVFTWNTSARAIIPKLFWMLEKGWFDEGAKPVRFRIVGTKTRAGSVEKLKQLPEGTVIEAETALSEELPF
jgi:hypothetical protein